MSNSKIAAVLAGLMIAVAGLCLAVRHAIAPMPSAPFVLDDLMPRQFGEWKELPSANKMIVNPQTKELLDKLYSQLLTRSYVNSRGYVIMLSLAYGNDQRGTLQAHKPEVCFPAQGFTLHSNEQTVLRTRFGDIESRRLVTNLGRRWEPVTYWFTMGGESVQSRWKRRWVEVRLGLTGQVPDGLLFRVSSIDDKSQHAFDEQQRFVSELLDAIGPQARTRLAGLP